MKFHLFLIIPLVLLLTACLDSTPAEGPVEATAEFDLLLRDDVTEEPLENFTVTVFLKVSGFSVPTAFGEFETDNSGLISSEIYSFTEDIISGIIIQYTINDETRTAEKETDLRLRFSPPPNSVSLVFDLNVS